MRDPKTIFVLLLLFIGCIDRIDVETDAERERLIVEGSITNVPAENRIKLSKTIRYSNERNLPVTGAIVSVVSSDGDIHCFEETAVGNYLSCPDVFAQSGKSYTLRIELDGRAYESTEQFVPEGAPFINLSYVPGKKAVLSELSGEVIQQAGVFITSTLPKPETSNFYRWRLIPTFIFETEWARPEYRRCWITEPNDYKDIFLHREREGGYDKEITFIPASRDMLFDYSLLVRQYNMTKETFDYWSSLKTQMENTGSILDTPPFSILGNIHNVEDPNEIVLGYFGVYRVQELRVKWNLEDLPYEFPYITSGCETVEFGEKECLNCLLYSSIDVTNVQPDWWE